MKARQHVAILCQFHLRFGVGGLCSHGEDVENETRAVQNLHAEFFFDVTELLGGEFIVENHHSHLALCLPFGEDVGTNFLKFSFSDVGDGTRSVQALCETFDGDGAGGLGEEFQFVEIFVGFAFALFFGDEADQDGGFRLDLGFDEFFHVRNEGNAKG